MTHGNFVWNGVFIHLIKNLGKLHIIVMHPVWQLYFYFFFYFFILYFKKNFTCSFESYWWKPQIFVFTSYSYFIIHFKCILSLNLYEKAYTYCLSFLKCWVVICTSKADHFWVNLFNFFSRPRLDPNAHSWIVIWNLYVILSILFMGDAVIERSW